MALSGVVRAQAFGGKGSTVLQVGLGLSEHYSWFPENGVAVKGRFSPLAGNFQFQAEFGVSSYVGIGATVGLDYADNLFGGSYAFLPGSVAGNNSFRSLAVPLGVCGNFHFFQLIADKSGKDIHADKLDIYAGLTLGSGPSFALAKPGYKHLGSEVGFMAFGGPQAGIRFYPSSNIGVYVEAGYGKAYIHGGLVVKFQK